MRDTPAHEFMPPLPGYSELPSIKLAREIDRFDASAELREIISRRDWANLAFVYAVAFIAALGFLYAAKTGLTRTEHQFQMDARR